MAIYLLQIEGQKKTQYKWYKNPPEIRGRHSFQVHIPKTLGAAETVNTPYEAWNLLITDEIIDIVVKYTNMKIQANKRDENVVDNCTHKDTNNNEIKACIGLLYVIGEFSIYCVAKN